jgi:predicted nucleotidyltransferase
MTPLDGVREIARRAGVELFVLFGSRARGEERLDSDWDFGYRAAHGEGAQLAGRPFDPDDLLAKLVGELGSDRVDLADLDRSSALLRYRVAAEGRLIHEARPNGFQDFQIEAVQFWCDVGPVLDRAYGDVLDGLGSR